MANTIPFTKWIWIPREHEPDPRKPQFVLFRKSVSLSRLPEKPCLLRVSADTRYKLYVNGELAEIGPSKGDRSVWFYDEVDISPYLKAGENILAAIVLHYPTERRVGNHSLFRTAQPGLYVEELSGHEPEPIDQTLEDFEAFAADPLAWGRLGFTADASWKCFSAENIAIVSENPYFAPLQILEEASGCPALHGWMLPGYDDSAWFAATPYPCHSISPAAVPGNLLKRTIPYMYRKDRQFDEVFRATGKVCAAQDCNEQGTAAEGFAAEEFAAQETAAERYPAEESAAQATAAKRFAAEVPAAQATAETHETADPKSVWTRLIRHGAPVVIPAHSRVSAEFSAGEELSGFLSLRMLGGAASRVEILCSESYVQKDRYAPGKSYLKQRLKADRCDFENGELEGYTDHYTVCGCGNAALPEAYEPFWLRTFRFIMLTIETADEPLTVSGFDYQESGYPLEAKTEVKTSDESLEPVWKISLNTLRRCMQETYMDCPFYEQLQYAMDSRSQILFTYMVSADDRLARKCIDDFSRSRRYDGMINCSYPCYEPNIIPGFSIYYILMIRDHMQYFGDKAFLRNYLAAIDGILEFFNRNLDARGLVGKVGGLNRTAVRYWSFIDWAPEWSETSGVPRATLQGPITMESLLYIAGLDAAAEILDYIGREDTAAEYRRRAESVREAVRKYCCDEKSGMITDGPCVSDLSQHCQVFALLTGVVTPQEGKAALLETLDHPSDYAQCTVAMGYYLFRAMEMTGLYARTDERWELWREMVRCNLTTCVENDGTAGRSDCHAWGSLALFELPAVTLGVSPAAPGFEVIRIAPVPGYMTHAEGKVITPKGMVYVKWCKKPDGSLDLEYRVPEGVKVITG